MVRRATGGIAGAIARRAYATRDTASRAPHSPWDENQGVRTRHDCGRGDGGGGAGFTARTFLDLFETLERDFELERVHKRGRIP